MIQVLGISDRKAEELSIKKAASFLSRRNFVWIDLENPKKEELKQVAGMFDFHPLSVDDCLGSAGVPKLKDFGSYLFLTFHRLSVDKSTHRAYANEVNVFLGKNYIVTVRKFGSGEMKKLRERVEASPQIFEGPDFLMHAVVDTFVDGYFPVLDHFDDMIEHLEAKIIKSDYDITREVMKIRRSIVEMKKVLGPQREVINKLTHRDTRLISDRASLYFRDVYDNIMRLYNMLETQRDLVSGAFEAHLSNTSNRMNEIMKKLTVIATIFLPLTFMTGVYGMNFRFMPELESAAGYPAALLLMLIVGAALYAYFRKKGWT